MEKKVKNDEMVDKVENEGQEYVNAGQIMKYLFIFSIMYYVFVHEDSRRPGKGRKGAALYRPPTYQKTFNFHEIIFTSDFESGNLKSVR